MYFINNKKMQQNVQKLKEIRLKICLSGFLSCQDIRLFILICLFILDVSTKAISVFFFAAKNNGC